jgi:hypothetical protein
MYVHKIGKSQWLCSLVGLQRGIAGGDDERKREMGRVVDRLRPTAQDPYATSCLIFFFSFFYLKVLDFSITQSPWVGTTISIVIHCSHRSVFFTALRLFPHALFVLSSIFLASKAKQWHCMLNLSPFPHILFTFYFQFILAFGCVVYDVFKRYFVKNLGFYFVMDLLKIPDPIRLTR